MPIHSAVAAGQTRQSVCTSAGTGMAAARLLDLVDWRAHQLRRRARVLVAALVAGVTALMMACSSSSVSVTAPSTAKCQVTATNSLATAPPAGASGEVSIETARDCEWTAASSAGWDTLTSADHGQGSGTVTYAVAANPEPSPRRTVLDVNG